MIIKDVMTKNPVCIDEDMTITEAKQLMMKHKFSKLPVLDSSKKLVGIITKNDIQKVSPSEATTLDVYEISYLLSKLTCKKFMTKKVITVDENQVVEEVARIMVDSAIGCVPVMRDGVIVGIITESDLFQLFTDMFGARYRGVRANFGQPDEPGEFAKIVEKIAEFKGNIVSVVTRESKVPGQRRITLKATDLTIEQMTSILNGSGAEIFDVRIV